MNPALAIQIIGLLAEAVPGIVSELRLLLSKSDPTPADWEALRVKVQKDYDDFIDEAGGRPPTTGG